METSGIWAAAWRGLSLVMDRMNFLQWARVDESRFRSRRVFFVNMPAQFYGIDATADLSVRDRQNLVNAGQRALETVTRQGEALRSLVVEARQERFWIPPVGPRR